MENLSLGKIGSRRGKSYHTIRRKKKAASDVNIPKIKSLAIELVNDCNYNCKNLEHDSLEKEPNATNLAEDDFSCEDDVHENCYILSDDDEMDDAIQEQLVEQENSDSGRFDSKAVETFRNLCFRHPSLSHNFIKDLLGSLNEIDINVPRDPRTLLRSNTKPVVTRDVAPGKYWHYGIPTLIEKLLSRGIHLPNTINLKVNIDGMPLSNSSKATFWPIQMTIDELKVTKPLLIGCYFHESSKPDNASEYLKEYIDDLILMKTLGHMGVMVNQVVYPLDAPALAFIKETQGHTGKNSCGKCDIVGDYKNKRTCFPSLKGVAREDSLFRNHVTYGKHHKSNETGPLEHPDLNTDMVKDFPAEPLHTLHLGVVKRILLCWTGSLRLGGSCSALQVTLKIPDDDVKLIDQHMIMIKEYHSSEYNRPSRKISDMKHWKGGEFGCLLDHTAMVVFKNRIPKEVYENFLLLQVATTICETNKHKHLLRLAKEFYKNFLCGFKKIYGDYAVSYNVHNLLHIADDVARFGPLESYSTTAFEARLGRMKFLVKGGNRRLEQLANRVYETIDPYIDLIKLEAEKVYPIMNHVQGGIEISRNCTMRKTKKDQWFLSKQNDILKYEGFIQKNNEIFLRGRKVISKDNVFTSPITSSILDVYKSDGTLQDDEFVIKIEEFSVKLFQIPCAEDGQFVYTPIRHTYNL